MSSQDYDGIRQPEPPKKQNKHWFGSMFVGIHVFGGIVLFLIVVWSAMEGGLESFPAWAYHPLFGVLGLILVQGESLIIYRLLRNPSRKTLKYTHMILMGLAFSLMVISIHCVYTNTSDHFNGPHQWMGLATIVLFTWQLLQGFLWRFWPGAPSRLVSWYHGAHAFFGVLIFLCACVSAMMGMAYDPWSDNTFGRLVENLFPISVVIYATLVVYLVMSPKFRRKDFPNFGDASETEPLKFDKSQAYYGTDNEGMIQAF